MVDQALIYLYQYFILFFYVLCTYQHEEVTDIPGDSDKNALRQYCLTLKKTQQK